MPRNALGLIETHGLIAAIEATDAAAKAAGIVVSSVELTDASFLTLRIEGELGAVQAACEASTAAAERVGEIVAVTIIANADDGLDAILPARRFVSKYHTDDHRPSLDPESGAAEGGTKQSGGRPSRKRKLPDSSARGDVPGSKVTPQMLKSMTVAELRRYARTLEGLSLKGREISQAKKSKLIEAISNLLDLE
ncbi:MAG: BMC domain-containing protein [candidate division Zixibacteria bacterium]|nr:BMC domain-containing protein [candidate division Zixibacteria bacterium]